MMWNVTGETPDGVLKKLVTYSESGIVCPELIAEVVRVAYGNELPSAFRFLEAEIHVPDEFKVKAGITSIARWGRWMSTQSVYWSKTSRAMIEFDGVALVLSTLKKPRPDTQKTYRGDIQYEL